MCCVGEYSFTDTAICVIVDRRTITLTGPREAWQNVRAQAGSCASYWYIAESVMSWSELQTADF